jgi:hypothetical protein
LAKKFKIIGHCNDLNIETSFMSALEQAIYSKNDDLIDKLIEKD